MSSSMTAGLKETPALGCALAHGVFFSQYGVFFSNPGGHHVTKKPHVHKETPCVTQEPEPRIVLPSSMLYDAAVFLHGQ